MKNSIRIKRELGDFIKRKRISLGLSKLEFAKLAKLKPSSQFIDSIETGETEFSPSSLRTICKALGLTEYYLERNFLDQTTNKKDVNKSHDEPYKGLVPFKESDQNIYFGRESIIERLKYKFEQTSIVGLIGASGSGKSSLIAAGLIPKLRNSYNLEIVSFRPGKRPFQSLAVSIAYLVIDSPDPSLEQITKLASSLEVNNGSLPFQKLKHQLRSGCELLIIIDQFEELFTQCDSSDSRQQFIDLLAEQTINQGAGIFEIRILITLRGDFFANIVNNRQLAEILEDNLVYLPPMSDLELKDAITKPSKMYGVSIENDLVELIIQQAGNESGILPLIQYCLSLLWNERENNKLSLDSYQQIGGLEGAVANQAERVFASFGEKTQTSMRRQLMRMVQVTGSMHEGTETRRKIPYNSISATQEESRVIEKMIKARLLTTDYDKFLETQTVELAHEAIIRHWKRLQNWLIEDRQFLLWQQTVEPLSVEWLISERSDSYILRGRHLEYGIEWAETRISDMPQNIKEFLKASIEISLKEASARTEEQASFLLMAQPEDALRLLDKIRSNKDWINARLDAFLHERKDDPRIWRVRFLKISKDKSQFHHLIRRLKTCKPSEITIFLDEFSKSTNDISLDLIDIVTNENEENSSRLRVACVLAQICPNDEIWKIIPSLIVKPLVNENPLHILYWTNALLPVSTYLLEPLKKVVSDQSVASEIRDASALVLMQLFSENPTELSKIALEVTPRIFDRFFEQLQMHPNHKSEIIRELSFNEKVQSVKSNEQQRIDIIAIGKKRAWAAALLARFGKFNESLFLFRKGEIEGPTQFVHNCKKLGVKIENFFTTWIGTPHDLERYWLTLTLGEFRRNDFSESRLSLAVKNLEETYCSNQSPAIHAVAGWLLKKWGYSQMLEEKDEAMALTTLLNLPAWFNLKGPAASIPFVKIPTGTFKMGATLNEKGAKKYETPKREVTISKNIYFCSRLVTRKEYQLFEEETGTKGLPEISEFSKSKNHPVVALTWYEANQYAVWLNKFLVKTYDNKRIKVRLPTEAEWEKACRADSPYSYSFGEDSSLLPNYAWFSQNSNYETHEYRTLRPNLYGLFNMHGNNWEWCQDYYNPYEFQEDLTDPCMTAVTERNVLRGGCWNLGERYSRSACRNWHHPTNRNYYIGLRIILEM